MFPCRKTVRRNHSPDSQRRGSATVELAVITPLFLMLVLGMLEFGRAFHTTSSMDSAVRDAGRLASMGRPESIPESMSLNDKVSNDIRATLSAVGFNSEAIEVSIVYADGTNAGSPFDLDDPDNEMQLFRIEATIPYTEVSAFPLRYLRDHLIKSSIVLRLGRSTLAS
ncbi:MAG: pilus assembly protein [Planctomycetaceae bacterium]